MIDADAVAVIRTVAGVSDDPTRGIMTVGARSCFFSNLPGVTVSSSAADSSTTLVYNVKGLPSKTATQSDGKAVVGHFVNHPPGVTTVTATDAATGNKIGSADAIVRAGFLTNMTVVPTP
jgi:hypothetical protein